MKEWDDARVIALDFETSGVLPEYALQPWRVRTVQAWPTSLAVVDRSSGTFVKTGQLFPDVACMRAVLERAIAHKQYVLAWNTTFDIQWFMAAGLEDLAMQVKWLDGMLLWRHWFIEPEYDVTDRYKRKPYNLEAAIAEVLPQYAGYKGSVDFHTQDPEELARLHQYNLKDAGLTWMLGKHFFTLLQQHPARLKAALIEAESLPLMARANLEGHVVDYLAARELQTMCQDIASKALAVLAPHGVTAEIVRSYVKLPKLIFDQWGHRSMKEKVGEKTGRVNRSTDKEVLHELAIETGDPRINLVRLYRGALNNETKFAKAPLVSAAYNEDGRTRPQVIPFGTYSGRCTYASAQGRNKAARPIGFALHQEKRGKEFRQIIAPPPGYTLAEFDAAGQEFRWMAIASRDETMLQLCRPGEDPHSYMGAAANSVDYRDLIRRVAAEEKEAKNQRQMGKVGNLSLQYRTSAKKLLKVARVDYGMDMRLPESERLWATYRQTYLGVPRYWEEQIRLTRLRGWVETFAGRRVQVVGNWDKDGWRMGSTAINYRIQGTGGDQKYLAIACLKAYCRRHGIYFAWDLHDGIYFYIPDAIAERAVQDMGRILNTLPYERAWGFTPPIPMPWDAKLGKSWGALKGITLEG